MRMRRDIKLLVCDTHIKLIIDTPNGTKELGRIKKSKAEDEYINDWTYEDIAYDLNNCIPDEHYEEYLDKF